MEGSLGSMVMSAAPVFLSTYNILLQVSPPSEDLKTPRSSLSDHKAPKTATYTSLEFFGFTIIFAIRSDLSKPSFFQLEPPSVDLYNPSPYETLFLVQVSPVPT